MATSLAATSRRGSRRAAAFAVFTIALGLVYWIALWRLTELALTVPHYSHLALIPFIGAYFLFVERREIFVRVDPSPLPGLAVTALGMLTAWWAQGASLGENDALSAAIFSLWLSWVGGFVVAFGAGTLRRALFPVAFLLFLVPIPSLLLDAIVTFLLKTSAEVTNLIFYLSSVPYYREGDFFSLPGLHIVIAPECSGIRSSIALIITSIVAGRMFLRSNGNRMLLVLAAIPVTILKNGLRIATICFLAIYVDRGFLEGRLHSQGGHAFFVLALLLMAPVLLFLRRREKRTPGTLNADSEGARQAVE